MPFKKPKEEMNADLHLHTIFSDSTYTPEQLIQESAKCGLSVVGVVDHDTVEGIDPVKDYAADKKIEVIPGIELTSEFSGMEVHILGYLLDYRDLTLRQKLDSLKQDRILRVHKIVEKLKNLGLELDAQSVFDLSGSGTVGRLHIARAMMAKGLVGSVFEAFRKYIGDRSPAYVLGFRLSIKEAIKLIKDAGGIPVLAHPYSLNHDELIPEFVSYGIMGLEAYYPEHTHSMVNFYLSLANKYHLLVTGGSDCHGLAKPDIRIGSLKVSYGLVEKLKQAKAGVKE